MNNATDQSFFGKLFSLLSRPFVLIANFTRHLLLLIIFFIILWYVIYLYSQNVELTDKTALVLAPKGFIVEQFSGNPKSQALQNIRGSKIPETRMRDLLKTIKNATTDERITALVLNPDYLWGAGLANLRELERGINAFRNTSGKPVVAMASGLSQSQYYFANMADEILMDPQGFFFLQGFGSYRNFFKDGLDKLGVDVHLFRVGEYKSAAEPYVRNDMSIEAKESALHYMNDLWETYLLGIAEKRNIELDALKNIIDEQAERLMAKNGSVADMVLHAGLVDRVLKRSFMNKHIAEISSYDDDQNSFRSIDFEDYLGLIEEKKSINPDRIAVVVAEGSILNGRQPGGTIGGVSTSELLEKARLDPSVKAVVLRVNSPGGGVFASEQIRREVDALKVAGKPVVASMGNVAASGGYWVSMTADSIWADEATITGSIGIYGLFMNFPKLYNKLGIHTDGVGTSKWVGAFNPDRELDPEFAKLIQSNIEYGYQQFISSVAGARNLEVDMVDKIARGRVWTARQARDLGLVDSLGGLSDAVEDAANKASLNAEYDVFFIEEQLSATEQFLVNMVAKASSALSLGSDNSGFDVEALIKPFKADLQLILDSSEGQVKQLAYCFCNLNSL